MKKLLMVIISFMAFTITEFAQFKEYETTGEFIPKIINHEKTAQWPPQSFYQRKAEWQWIVDSTWGPGASTAQKLQIFNTYANLIHNKFALFYRLNLDWDSLRTFWFSKITDNTSKGGFHQIMSHLAWTLKDGHSASWDVDISHMPLNPGTPLFLIPCYVIWDVSHFGASLSANSDGEIFVLKTIDNHPLGLEPGDVILGYEGVKWMDIVEELMDFHIPIYGQSSTNEEARNHDLLMSAGMNWHMFSTIDIIKHSTGDTLHLSLEPMLQMPPGEITFPEQMDIPGVPKPDYGQGEPGSYGIIDNLNIGYIYIYNHITGSPTINQIFLEAVQNLYNTDGLIIDLRSDVGGYFDQNLNGGLDLLINKTITELKFVIRCNPTNLYSLCDYYQTWFNFTPNPQTFFQKPIAILIGPKCASTGDITAYRLKSLPNGRFFGRTSAAAVGGSEGYYDFPPLPSYPGWVFYTHTRETYHPDYPYQYLSGKDFPVDKKIWLTKEDVANGYDTVVEEAVSWINNLSYCFNATIDKYYTQDNIEITADVKNPNNHTLSIIAYILNNDIVIDSLDCAIVENKISETWSVPGNSEDFYSVTIKTKDSQDSTVHTLPNIARFTTAGPVVLDSISWIKVSTYYSVKPFLKNQSTVTTITNASVRLVCNDPWVISITPTTRALPNIPPGSIVSPTSPFTVTVNNSIFPGYFNFKVEVIRNGWPYWIDSMQVTNNFQLIVSVANGWNMVSIPGLHPVNQNVLTWWPGKDPLAEVFKYGGVGYIVVNTATPGEGYWMKHSGARTYNTGDEWPAGGIQIVPHAPIAGVSGWNLIGGYELSVTAANVTTIPPGLQGGPIYKYSGGYAVATTLDPGYGYWIKLTGPGQIIIPETLSKGTEPVEYFPENWGRIVLTDATGINYTLYAVKGQVDLSQYDLPPAPPTGMFDIRFSSGRIAEDINSAIKTIDMSGVTYPLTVRVEGMDIRLMDETGKNVNVNLKAGENVVISDEKKQKLMVSGELIPAKYALEQNYPNPFNPNTVIEFSLPEDVGNVKLSIYNTLGEKVAELVNTSLVAGKYSYQWNAKNVATGMYIYELRTDKFVSVKKMILLK